MCLTDVTERLKQMSLIEYKVFIWCYILKVYVLQRILKIQELHHVVELLTLLISMARPFDLLQCLPLSTGQVVTSKVTAGNATDAFSLSYTQN